MADMIDNPFTFCWTDLLTGDVAEAREFYTELFGWSATEKRSPDGTKYTMFKKGDLEVAGMMEFPREGIPPVWMPYVAVNDVDASVKKAKELGAEVQEEPQNEPEGGRFAVLKGPTGAIFALWHKD